LPKIAGIEEVKKAVFGLERDTGLRNDRLNHRQDVYMVRENFHKLTIISFLEGEGKSTLGRNTIEEFIENYEKKHGSLKTIAKKILDSANDEELDKIIKLRKNRPSIKFKTLLENSQ
jgi:excinuclease UvrABC ATPase subunit